MSQSNQAVSMSSDMGEWKTGEYENIHSRMPRYEGQKDKYFLITDSHFDYIISRIIGTVLTIVEAGTDDKEKREAIKSLVKRTVWQEAEDPTCLRITKVD